MSISSHHKAVAHAAAQTFGGTPTVTRYWNDARSESVDVLECVGGWGAADVAVSSFCTIGVSDTALFSDDGVALHVRTELVGACYAAHEEFAGDLASAGFSVRESGRAAPGVVLPNVIKPREDSDLLHCLLLPPFLWDDRLETLRVPGGPTVAWLLVVPISETELKLALASGVPALEDALESAGADILDLRRAPVA